MLSQALRALCCGSAVLIQVLTLSKAVQCSEVVAEVRVGYVAAAVCRDL